MFELLARKNNLVIRPGSRELLTSGSVNVYTVRYTFNSAWDGMERIAVFRAGDDTVSILLDTTNTCTIPWEVLQARGRVLYAGVYGTLGGEVVLPTIWAALGEIKDGASPGESAQSPTPGLYEQILAKIGDLSELDTEERGSLVAAINELYSMGGSGGTGNVSSSYINRITVIEQGEYDALETKSSKTLYLIRG